MDTKGQGQVSAERMQDEVLPKNAVNEMDPKKSKNEDMTELNIQRDILQRIMERKLRFCGHICRMAPGRLIKEVLLGVMDK